MSQTEHDPHGYNPMNASTTAEGLLAIDINQTQASQSMTPILRAIISICMFQQSLNDSEHYNQSGVSISTNVLEVYMLQEVNRQLQFLRRYHMIKTAQLK